MQYLQRKLTTNRSSFKLVNQVLRHFYSSGKLFDAGQPTPSTHPQLLKEGEITPGITCDEYVSRRKRLLEFLPEHSVAIVAAAPVKMMTDVVPYTFRQDADYLYITGCQQPGGIAVLGHDLGLCMFMPEPSPHDVTWQGQIAGVDVATEYFKANQSFPISQLPKVLPNMIKNCSKLYHNVKTAIPTYTDLEAFQKAAYNGCQALLQTMLHSKTSPYESILSAKVEYECRVRGAQRMAFNPVVGGGPNGSVIHYSRNDQKVKDGDLVLMDIGCELHGYVSDLTRTWPPCGRFSDVHKELYALILETNKECIELCKPGTSIQRVHNYSVDKLARGLKEIGILKDNRLHSYHQLNPTSIGHYLGMDVHDCSKIGYDRTLKPGVVITIEPGVYIPPNFDCAPRYQGIGIRIEDEVLITDTGYEVLTGSLPKETNHIETLLNNHSYGVGTETSKISASSF
ncbi:putative xaa-Pro aminopeptidase [Helianthus annuus]|nr:putative xaa-Pro aminopeptidase [Helianthus annuus]